jgi:hypothetical protein
MLWAWERPEQLSFLNTANIGVAYLSETIYLKQNRFVIRPRMQPLKVDKHTYLEAVVRIESDRQTSWNPSDEELHRLSSAIVQASGQPGVKSLQIDFDAKESERSFYKHLLAEVRASLPREKTLSMTALASWCLGDQWLTDVPVDEVVPMLFSMGAGKREAFDYIASSRRHDLSYFQKCVGLSINDRESLGLLAKQTTINESRVYFFSGKPWSPASVQKAQSEVHRWQTTFAI